MRSRRHVATHCALQRQFVFCLTGADNERLYACCMERLEPLTEEPSFISEAPKVNEGEIEKDESGEHEETNCIEDKDEDEDEDDEDDDEDDGRERKRKTTRKKSASSHSVPSTPPAAPPAPVSSPRARFYAPSIGAMTTPTMFTSRSIPKKFVVFCTRIYCIVSRVPCFRLHFDMLRLILGQERILRMMTNNGQATDSLVSSRQLFQPYEKVS